MKLSARNILTGSVSEIRKGAVNAEVTLTLKGGNPIVASITNGSVDNLALAVGQPAAAIIKASSIIIGTNLGSAKLSARNILAGKVLKVIDGPVSAEVELEVAPGLELAAVITYESAKSLDLKAGSSVSAIFKASSVILGVG